jgi:Holliday junction resolvase
MANNAAKGAARENRVRRHLETDGYWVVRSAASKGSLDLLAVKRPQMLGVQVKSGELWRVGVAEHDEMWELCLRIGATPVVVQCQDRKPDLWWRSTGPKAGRVGRALPYVPFSLDEVDTAARLDQAV